MERTFGGLVAISFITILGMGIVSLISSLASIVSEQQIRSADRKMITWIILLLLIHLRLFWETLTILERDDWIFAAFVFVISGPVLLFFASQTLLTNQDPQIQTYTGDHYQAVCQRFFVILCLVITWAITFDFLLGGRGIQGVLDNLSLLIVFAALAAARSERAQVLLTFVASILMISLFGLAGLQVID